MSNLPLNIVIKIRRKDINYLVNQYIKSLMVDIIFFQL